MKITKQNLTTIKDGIINKLLPHYLKEYHEPYTHKYYTSVFETIYDIVLEEEDMLSYLDMDLHKKFEERITEFQMQITGNDCGSFTCNRHQAQENCVESWDLCLEALNALYGINIPFKIIQEWEYIDIITRDYIFPIVILIFYDIIRNYVKYF